jgi:hypothetical protein
LTLAWKGTSRALPGSEGLGKVKPVKKKRQTEDKRVREREKKRTKRERGVVRKEIERETAEEGVVVERRKRVWLV